VEVLGFAARRLFSDLVGMLFAVREGEQRTVVLEGLQELTVGPLPEEAASELFADRVGRPVDQWTGARIVSEAAGTRAGPRRVRRIDRCRASRCGVAG
jgi:hypothetical protein